MRAFSNIHWYTFLASVIYYGHLLLTPVATYLIYIHYSDEKGNWWFVLPVLWVLYALLLSAIRSGLFVGGRWLIVKYQNQSGKICVIINLTGLVDNVDCLGLIRKFSRDQDLQVTSEIGDHLNDNLEITRINYSF